MRNCWNCGHFVWLSAVEDYDTDNGGFVTLSQALCGRKLWRLDGTASQSDYRKALERAETCVQFSAIQEQPVDAAK